jgi:hypothetical protein
MTGDAAEVDDVGETGGNGDAGEGGGRGDIGEGGGRGDMGEGGGRGDIGEGGPKGDAEEEGRGDTGDGGTSIALWFVMPCQTALAHRDVRLGANEETSPEGVSVSSPSSRNPCSELSDGSGEGEEGVEVL